MRFCGVLDFSMIDSDKTSLTRRYRPAYKAFKNDSSFNFMMFFFIFFFQTLVTIVQTIGFPGSGTCGIIMAITQFGGGGIGILVGIFVLAIAFGYGACAAGNIFMLSKVRGDK